jgi:hypothetical protein
MADIAEIADKFTRNEILSSNEIRQGIGFKPSSDPKADQLVNSNMPQPGTDMGTGAAPPDIPSGTGSIDTSSDPGSDAVSQGLDDMNGVIDQIYATLGIEDG